MKRIKVFKPDYVPYLQESIDKWIEEEKPDILSVTPTIAQTTLGHTILVTVLYEDNKDKVKI